MLHNFWFMASKFPIVRCHVTEFYADSDEKISFSKFWFFLVDCPKYSFEFVLAIFRKMRWRKISKFRFSGSIFNALKRFLKGEKLFPKFELFGLFRNQVWDPPIKSMHWYQCSQMCHMLARWCPLVHGVPSVSSGSLKHYHHQLPSVIGWGEIISPAFMSQMNCAIKEWDSQIVSESWL